MWYTCIAITGSVCKNFTFQSPALKPWILNGTRNILWIVMYPFWFNVFSRDPTSNMAPIVTYDFWLVENKKKNHWLNYYIEEMFLKWSCYTFLLFIKSKEFSMILSHDKIAWHRKSCTTLHQTFYHHSVVIQHLVSDRLFSNLFQNCHWSLQLIIILSGCILNNS